MEPLRRTTLPQGVVLSPTPNVPPPPYTKYPSTISIPQAVEPPTPPSYSEATSVVSEDNRSRSSSLQLEWTQVLNRRNPHSAWDTVQFFPMLTCGTPGLFLFLTLAIVTPAIMTIVGGLYMFDCPTDSAIPVILMLGGVASGIKTLTLNILWYRKVSSHNKLLQLTFLDHFCTALFVLWYVVASVALFRLDMTNLGAPNYYCDKTLYFIFFVILILFTLLIATMATAFILIVSCRRWQCEETEPAVNREDTHEGREQTY